MKPMKKARTLAGEWDPMNTLDYEPIKRRKPSRFQIYGWVVCAFGLIVLAIKLFGLWRGWW